MAYEHWEIEQELGRGGQGITYQVTHRESGHVGVMKLLHDDAPDRDLARARMTREVANLKLVTAAGGTVPRVLDDFVDDEDQSGFVMDFIDGVTLDVFMRQEGPLHLNVAIEVLRELAHTIAAGHSEGVGHRDIKPENIMVTRHDDVTHLRLLDYGLSFSDDDTNDTAVDETIRNKFLHLPELLVVGEGRRYFESDVSSLAGILLYMLNGGVPPRSLTDGDGRAPHRREDTAPQCVLTEDQRQLLDTLFGRAFAGTISERFATAKELMDRLDHVLTARMWTDDEIDLEELAIATTQEIEDHNTHLARKLGMDRARRVAKELADTVAGAIQDVAHGHFALKVSSNIGTKSLPFEDSLDCPCVMVTTQHVHTNRMYRTTYAFRSSDGVEVRVSRQAGLDGEEPSEWTDITYLAVSDAPDAARDALIADVKRQQAAGIRAIRDAEADDPTVPDLEAQRRDRNIRRTYGEDA